MLAKLPFCLFGLAAMLQPLHACNVPVFRYALERWPAEPFNVVLFYRGNLDPAQKALADSVEQASRAQSANVDVISVDLATRFDPILQKVWEQQTNAILPWTVVLPPHGDEMPGALFSGRLDSNTVAQLVDSPVRHEIAQRLLAGDSAVWLMLESGDKQADDRIADLLSRELPQQQKEITLPPPDPEDPVMHATLPLRIGFSFLRMSRTDLAEQVFARMLLHGESQTNRGPVVFPIFGRGRALAVLSGNELTPKVIKDASRFICGACSCEVKELNPGKDLLIAANWNSVFGPQQKSPLEAATVTLTNPPVPVGYGLQVMSGNKQVIDVSVGSPSKRGVLAIAIGVAAGLALITGTIAFLRRPQK
jgi:hypothetical protein